MLHYKEFLQRYFETSLFMLKISSFEITKLWTIDWKALYFQFYLLHAPSEELFVSKASYSDFQMNLKFWKLFEIEFWLQNMYAKNRWRT